VVATLRRLRRKSAAEKPEYASNEQDSEVITDTYDNEAEKCTSCSKAEKPGSLGKSGWHGGQSFL